MKKYFIIIFLLFTNLSFSQYFLSKRWDYRYGGTSDDELSVIIKTNGNGFLLGGFSNSNISGQKTQPQWGLGDYWIVKIDSLGNFLWDKRFGGTKREELTCALQTNDGGFLLGGFSFSNTSGDKTQDNWDNTLNTNDYWIIKTDSMGNTLWDKRFGGSKYDVLRSAIQTDDGGYLLGGSSNSLISGDKTQSTWGNSIHEDFWVLKIDSLGIKQWDKRYGGTGDEGLQSILKTHDGNFLLAGTSNSPISGDKSENCWNNSGDYWIIKIDQNGNKLWDKRYGGSSGDGLYCINQTLDNGFILGGLSTSDSSGDKSQNNWVNGALDGWYVKIDSLGNKQWDKRFGGFDQEEIGNIVNTPDSGFMFSFTSYSNISGDKTEQNSGQEQMWIVGTDKSGNKLWDKTVHTDTITGHEENCLGVLTNDGCYLFAGYSRAHPGRDKTQDSWNGTYDFWIIKYCETIGGFSSSNNVICEGSCVNFTNFIDHAVSYRWLFPGGTPAFSNIENPSNICYYSPGVYDVELIGDYIGHSDTILISNFITVNSTPPISPINFVNDTLFVSPGYYYQWIYSGILIPGAIHNFYKPLVNGYYSVTIRNDSGCSIESNYNLTELFVNETNPSLSEVKIFPNPTFGLSKLTFNSNERGNIRISLNNLTGEETLLYDGTSGNSNNFSLMLNGDEINSGIYIVTVKSEKGVRKVLWAVTR